MRPTVHQLLVQLEQAPLHTSSNQWGPNTRAAVREAVELRWVERAPNLLTLTPQGQRALEGERRWDILRQRASVEDTICFRTRAWARMRVFGRTRAAETVAGDWAA